MLLGSMMAGLMEEFVSRERLMAMLPKRPWVSAAVAALAGVVLPVCECAIVPVVRRLARKGLPLQACIAYLLAAPIVNPVVAASTALAYRMDMRVLFLRMVLGYVIALTVGLLAGRVFKGSSAFVEGAAGDGKPSCSCGHDHDHDHDHGADEDSRPAKLSLTMRILRSFRHGAEDFIGVGPYLILGAFVAAVATTYIDRSSFLELCSWPFASSALMIALAFLLNLCSQADAFVAASFNGLVPMSSQLAFMLIGPILDLKLLLMYRTLFKKRAIVLIGFSSLVIVTVAALLLSLLDGGFR